MVGVHALGGDESLRSQLVTVWVAEGDACKGSATVHSKGNEVNRERVNSTQGAADQKCHSPTRVVDDLLDYAADVTIALSVVVVPQLSWVLVQVGVGPEDPARLPLRANDTTPVG